MFCLPVFTLFQRRENIENQKVKDSENKKVDKNPYKGQREHVLVFSIFLGLCKKLDIRKRNPKNYDGNEHLRRWENKSQLAIKFQIIRENKEICQRSQQKSQISYNGIF